MHLWLKLTRTRCCRARTIGHTGSQARCPDQTLTIMPRRIELLTATLILVSPERYRPIFRGVMRGYVVSAT